MHRHLILICHDAQGHLANGDRQGVQRVLAQAPYLVDVQAAGHDCFEIVCADAGRLWLHAPGLARGGTFRRMALELDCDIPSDDILTLLLDLMRAGNFGLMVSLGARQFIVSRPQQVISFPWLPQPPLLVRSVRDLSRSLETVA
ncbi:MAG: hypothetical protein GX613_12060 [Chloroflexi bacterium]|nr:hypothetical protein [Chloroflexota bacterium]